MKSELLLCTYSKKVDDRFYHLKIYLIVGSIKKNVVVYLKNNPCQKTKYKIARKYNGSFYCNAHAKSEI